MKRKKLIIFLGALFLALTVSVGTYAYTFNIATTGFNVTAAGAGITTQQPAPPGDQPDWNEVLPQSEAEQEILRPNAPGSYIQLTPFGDSSNYLCVDESAPDDDSTYVYTPTLGSGTFADSYGLTEHTGVGTITSVTVYARARATFPADTHSAQVGIITYSTAYLGSGTLLPTAYTTLSATWTTNPNTGNEWTWTEIDALQSGVRVTDAGFGGVRVTQVFVVVDYELPPIIEGQVPEGDLFIVTPHPSYTGDLLMNIYVTNTGPLRLAYRYLNLKLYVANSLEAGETPNYQILSLENGVATFNMEGGSASSYTVSVVGGGYALISGDANEWGAGWNHIPELYCEVVQR